MAIPAAHLLITALADAGVIPAAEHVRRVVIDAKYGSVVVIHVELVGDERVLEVVSTLDGVEIRTTEAVTA